VLSPSATVGFIGFGAAGALLGSELARRGAAVRAFDSQLDAPESRVLMLLRMQRAGVGAAQSLAELVGGAKLVISVAGVEEAASLARNIAGLLQPGQVFLQLSALALTDRHSNAAAVAARGALYIEGQPVESLHLGGPGAADLVPALNGLGFNVVATCRSIGELAQMTYDPSPVTQNETPDPGSPPWRGELP
jgi:hypothetical protein